MDSADQDPGSPAEVRRMVADYAPADRWEQAARGRFLAELDRLPRPCDEDADPVHVVASAVVVGRRGTVLHRHKRLGRWMQPGGHVDPGEAPPAAALREAEEETGLALAHPPEGPLLLHLDVHPAAQGHTHLDLRYLLLGPDDDPQPPPGESPDARWYGWDEAAATVDDSLGRALRVARDLAARRAVEWGLVVTADDPLYVLLRVQDLDTAIAQLEHRRAALPERRDVEAAADALAELAARARELDARRQALLSRQAELEEQVAAVTGRRKALEDRLYAARGSAARDLQAMDAEIRHLAERRAEIEEVELEVMVEQEPVDAELAQVAGERAQLEAAASSLGTALVEAESVVNAEMTTLTAARRTEAAKLPTDLADRYEVLRGRLAGVGAARLVGNRCEGCHLELPSAEVDRIRHLPPGTVVTCDQCGRILVRAPAAG